MQLVRRFRLPALFCAVAVLVCELIAHPVVAMGVSDDGPYILIAQKLAATGHIVYNGNTTPMLGWQLYLGAAFIKLFGFSYTAVRMSTLLVASALAFILQRSLVRAGITERNATIGSLALVLSPLYLELSVTYMTDIFGLFAIVLCLYGCLRAMQTASARGAIGWLCFAVVSNDICGSSRQIAWLGVLVMVPSTLWLLRANRRVLLGGAAAAIAGASFIFACMHWFARQPYNVHEPLLPSTFPVTHTASELLYTFLDIPFLLLPVVALFIPQIRRCSLRTKAVFLAVFLLYARLSIHRLQLLEPTLGDWVTVRGGYGYLANGGAPLLLHTDLRALLTILSLSGLFGLITSWSQNRSTPSSRSLLSNPTWDQLGVLLGPFAVAYCLLLVPRATTIDGTIDRYLLPILLLVLLCVVRYYQEKIEFKLPLAGMLLVAAGAIYGVVVTHNLFSLYRARLLLADQLRDSGIPETSVDNGWEYNFNVELDHSKYINDERMVLPAHAYFPVPAPAAGLCQMSWYKKTPHIHPLYGVSSDPNSCYGPAPFAPVHYSRWPYRTPGTLYVVRYTAPSAP